MQYTAEYIDNEDIKTYKATEGDPSWEREREREFARLKIKLVKIGTNWIIQSPNIDSNTDYKTHHKLLVASDA